jgi:hypothetical protein
MRKNMVLFLSCLGIWSFFSCAVAYAYWDGFGPYREGEEPNAFSCQQMEDVSPERKGKEPGEEVIVYKFKSKDGYLVQFGPAESGADGLKNQITLTDSSGKVLGRLTDINTPFWGFTSKVGDFNNDGKPDFAVYVGNGSNGVGAEEGAWIFFLSCGKDYSVVELATDSIGMNDLVQLGKDGCLRIIHMDLIYAPESVHVPPGMQLYFRLYRLLKVSGSEIVEDNSSDPRFPKMVAYAKSAEQKNHKETKLLSTKEKKEIIKNSEIFLKYGKNELKYKDRFNRW